MRLSASLKMVGQACSLGGLGFIAATLVVVAQSQAGPVVLLREREDLEASLAEVLPPSISDNRPAQDTRKIGPSETTYYLARKDGRVTGAAFEVVSQGYGGAIRMVLGLNPEGRLFGVRVLSHKETPGLGDKIEIAKSRWIRMFDGRGLGDPPLEAWKVSKDGGDFDVLSGATITPRAVVRGVREGLVEADARRESLFELDDEVETPRKGGPDGS